jgi:hypothetical protein
MLTMILTFAAYDILSLSLLGAITELCIGDDFD